MHSYHHNVPTFHIVLIDEDHPKRPRRSAFDVLFRARLDTTKVAKLCFAMTVYMGIMLAISVTLCAALLRKVKQATKKWSLHQGLKFNKDNSSYCSYHGGDFLSINGLLKCLGI